MPFNQSTVPNLPSGADAVPDESVLCDGVSGGYPVNVFNTGSIAWRGVATDFRNSLVHKWNVAVQQELPWQSALEDRLRRQPPSPPVVPARIPTPAPTSQTPDSSINCNSLRPVLVFKAVSRARRRSASATTPA